MLPFRCPLAETKVILYCIVDAELILELLLRKHLVAIVMRVSDVPHQLSMHSLACVDVANDSHDRLHQLDDTTDLCSDVEPGLE